MREVSITQKTEIIGKPYWLYMKPQHIKHAFELSPLKGGERSWLLLISLLLVTSIACRLFVTFRYEINWDEFYYLSFVYKFINGDLGLSLQTFHVRFFTWLPSISVNEADQIVASRTIMLIMQLMTALMIYKISRLYLSVNASLFAVLSYFSFSYVLRTGTNFRADPIATLCLMSALYLILAKKDSLKALIITGVLVAVSVLITIKSAIYLPTLALASIMTLASLRNLRRAGICALTLTSTAISSFVILYIYHQSGVDSTSLGSDTNLVSKGFSKTVNHDLFFPQKEIFLKSLMPNIAYWLALLLGLRLLLTGGVNRNKVDIKTTLTFLIMLIPLASILLYRNAFPYFYSFILAPASIICGVAWNFLPWHKSPKEAFYIASFFLAFMSFGILLNGLLIPSEKNLDRQRHLLDVVHRTFPEPVNYFDRCSMVSSFPQKGFFMSTWGIDNYTKAGAAVLETSMKNHNPVFFVANVGSLDVSDKTPLGKSNTYKLLNRDIEAIKENYIHHWGELYVAGKHFSLIDRKSEIEFSILIDGSYTLEGASSVNIDGKEIEPGQTLLLSSGSHTISPVSTPGAYTLRWGRQLYRPANPPGKRAIFNGF